MDYPWATEGTKVVYIGPEVIMMALAPYGFVHTKAPFQKDIIYTIAKVGVLSLPQLDMGEVICLSFVGVFTPPAMVDLFQPTSEKDKEVFLEMLNKLPHDLIVEDLSERILETQEP